MRRTRGMVAVLSCLVLCCWASLVLAQESLQPLVARVEAVGITVAGMERSVAFYTNVLAFEKVRTAKSPAAPTNTCRGSSDSACGWCACDWARSSST
jgi:hypothetical protein